MTYKSYSNLETRCLKLQTKPLFHSFSDTFSSDQTVIDQERKCIDNTDIQTYVLGLSQIWNLQDKCSPSKHKIYHAWVPNTAEDNKEKKIRRNCEKIRMKRMKLSERRMKNQSKLYHEWSELVNQENVMKRSINISFASSGSTHTLCSSLLMREKCLLFLKREME